MAPASWTVLAAAVTRMTTTACRVAAAVTVATGPRAGGPAAPASRRPSALCSVACLPTQPSASALQSSHASPWAHRCAILEASALTRASQLCPPAGQGTPFLLPLPARQRTLQGQAQLSRPAAPGGCPRSVLRFLIIPEVLNVIAANLGGRRVRGLMTTAGSSDPSPEPRRKDRIEEGRKVWLSVRASVHLSVGARRLLKHGQRDL